MIGIHSSIGTSLVENRHVPIDRYRESWDRMVKGEAWGSLLSAARFDIPPEIDKGGFLGVQLQAQEEGLTVMDVIAGSPAEKGGLRQGDILLRFNGKPVEDLEEFVLGVAGKEPGTQVTIEFKRGGSSQKLQLTLGKRD